MKLAARTHVYEDTRTALHLIYERKSRKVHLCVWESPSGDYFALSKAWLKERVDNHIDPTPELLALYASDGEQQD